MDFHVLFLSGTWSKLGFLTAGPGGWEAVTVCVAALVQARAFASFFLLLRPASRDDLLRFRAGMFSKG